MFSIVVIRWLPEMQDLVKQLKDKIDAKIKAPRPQIPVTGRLSDVHSVMAFFSVTQKIIQLYFLSVLLIVSPDIFS